MPLLIEHIDAIARQKQRDVLFLRFSDPAGQALDDDGLFSSFDWETSAGRQAVIKWLDENQVAWHPCGDFAATNSMCSYAGQLYIDVPFDEADPIYQKVLAYLENPDGSMRLPGVLFYALQLHIAMKNAHHDEPGFWERWAENF
jgi:hypothetical protein